MFDLLPFVLDWSLRFLKNIITFFGFKTIWEHRSYDTRAIFISCAYVYSSGEWILWSKWFSRISEWLSIIKLSVKWGKQSLQAKEVYFSDIVLERNNCCCKRCDNFISRWYSKLVSQKYSKNWYALTITTLLQNYLYSKKSRTI